MCDYGIVEEQGVGGIIDFAAFYVSVKARLNEGWECLGAPFFGANRDVVLQAMILKDKD